jgi:hypothetical protein
LHRDWNCKVVTSSCDVGYRYTQERLLPWLEEKPGAQARDESAWARVS